MLKAEESRVGKPISMLDIQPKHVRMELLSNSDEVSHKRGPHLAPKQTGDLEEACKGQHVSGPCQPTGVNNFEHDSTNHGVEGQSQPYGHHGLGDSKVGPCPHGSNTRIEQTCDPYQAEADGKNQSGVNSAHQTHCCYAEHELRECHPCQDRCFL